jgi:hypothetical protein
MMPLEWIKVANCSKQFETVPVKMVLYEILKPMKDAPCLGADRYQLLEIDGYWLVIHQWVSPQRSHEAYRCFAGEKDAWDYLDMCGIDKPQED